MDQYIEKLYQEIIHVVAPKLYNINKGTASVRDIQTVKECTGFISLIKHSNLTSKEIYRLWGTSNLKFQ